MPYAPHCKERESWSSPSELLGSLHRTQGSSVGSSLPKTASMAEAFPSEEAPNQNPHVSLRAENSSSFPRELGARI